MPMVSCARCMTVVDTENAPVKKSEHRARGNTLAFAQEDVTCPECGNIIVRKINGKTISPKSLDPRIPPPPPPFIPSDEEESSSDLE